MDTQEPQVQRDKAQLISAIAESRRDLAFRLDSTGDSLNLVERVRHHFRESTWEWLTAVFGGGLAVGLSRPRRRPGQKVAGRGLLGLGVKAAFTLLKPMALLYLQRAIGSFPAAVAGNNGFHVSRVRGQDLPTRRQF